MQLTHTPAARVRVAKGTLEAARRWILPVAAAAYAAIFWIDHATGTAPFQHLYYLPIILMALAYGYAGSLAGAIAAIILYHLANPSLWTEPDVVQILLFLAVGAVTAKLAGDARKLRILAMTDDLTGLHNLRSFELHLARSIREARRSGTPVSLLVADVDRLKEINDRHGHLAGAEAVRAVGRIISRSIAPQCVPCRYGGDEFVIALPGQDAESAMRVAHVLREAVNNTAPILLGRVWPAGTLSISVGVAVQPFREGEAGSPHAGDMAEGEALFRDADAALYAAKSAGRNQVSRHARVRTAAVEPSTALSVPAAQENTVPPGAPDLRSGASI